MSHLLPFICLISRLISPLLFIYYLSILVEVLLCHGSAGTPLGTHAGGETLGLQDARTAIRT
jgi:hypothetical protein